MLTAFPRQIALLGAGLGGPFGPPPGATLQARQVHALWAVFFFAAIGVAAVVYGLIFWSIVKYRKRSDDLPPQFRENVPLEIAYTAIPLLIVAGLFILTYRTEGFVDHIATGADPAMLANPDVGPALERLTAAYQRDRGVRAFEAVDRALVALAPPRNAGTKIVADWVVLQL